VAIGLKNQEFGQRFSRVFAGGLRVGGAGLKWPVQQKGAPRRLLFVIPDGANLSFFKQFLASKRDYRFAEGKLKAYFSQAVAVKPVRFFFGLHQSPNNPNGFEAARPDQGKRYGTSLAFEFGSVHFSFAVSRAFLFLALCWGGGLD